MEGGTLQNIQQLAEDHHCPPPVDHDLFVGRVQVQAKRGKVPGNNGITNELLKIGGDVAAMHFVPLVLKCVPHQYEPLSWKGGTKGAGAVDDPQSYR